MKRGIIIARKHGSSAMEALGPAEPYPTVTAQFKKDFQARNGIHEVYAEAWLCPIEHSKRVPLQTKKQAEEAAAAHKRAQDAANKAAAEAKAKADGQPVSKPKAEAKAKAETTQTESK